MFTGTKGPPARRLAAWMDLAMSSLPVPVLPVTRIGMSERAWSSASRRMRSMLLSQVRICSKAPGSSRARSRAISDLMASASTSRRRSRARSRAWVSCSGVMGLTR